MKKKKPKKRKLAGLEVFAAEVYRHKSLMQESKRNVLQCQFVKKSPIGRPPKVCLLCNSASLPVKLMHSYIRTYFLVLLLDLLHDFLQYHQTA